jgi:integrase
VTGKGMNNEPKVREVPLRDDALVGLLKRQIAENSVPRDTYWHPDRKDQLWPQTQDRMRQIITRACRDAGVDYFGPHTLRHTFATRYLQSGGDIYTLSKILGHSSVKITEKVYAHLITADLLKLSRERNVQLQLPATAATAA